MLVGDLITSIDGISVAGLNGSGVANLIASHAPGASFQVTVTRGGTFLAFDIVGQPPVYQ
jgi:S1-C subfamily serine protease